MTKIDGMKQIGQPTLTTVGRSSGDPQVADIDGKRQDATAGGKASPQAVDAARSMAVIEATNAISSFVQNVSRELKFDIDDQTGRTVITVMDQSTEQVIRQIPAEEVLALAKVLSEAPEPKTRGILIDGEA